MSYTLSWKEPRVLNHFIHTTHPNCSTVFQEKKPRSPDSCCLMATIEGSKLVWTSTPNLSKSCAYHSSSNWVCNKSGRFLATSSCRVSMVGFRGCSLDMIEYYISDYIQYATICQTSIPYSSIFFSLYFIYSDHHQDLLGRYNPPGVPVTLGITSSAFFINFTTCSSGLAIPFSCGMK